MQKIIKICFGIIFFVACFVVAYPQYNTYVSEHYEFYHVNHPNTKSYMVNVNRTNEDIDPIRFHQDMDTVFTNLDVYFSRSVYTSSDYGAAKQELYLSSNTRPYIMPLFSKGNLDDLYLENQQFTNTGGSDYRIAILFSDKQYTLSSALNDPENGGFYLFGCQCEDLPQRLEQGFYELNKKYSITYSLAYEANDYDFNYSYEYFSGFRSLFFVSFLYFLFSTISLYLSRKSIGLLKLEGYTLTNLFIKFVELPFVITLVISYVLGLFISSILLNASLLPLSIFISFYSTHFLIIVFMVQVMILINIYVLNLIPASSIKGNTNYSFLLSGTLILKCSLTLLLIPQLTPFIQTIRSLYLVNTNYKIAHSIGENIYQFGTSIGSNYIDFFGSDELSNLNQALYDKYHMFQFAVSYFPINSDFSNIRYAIKVDEGYLRNFLNDWNNYNLDEPIILFPKNYPDKEVMINLIWETMYANNWELTYDQIQIGEFDPDLLHTFDLNALLFGEKINYPLFSYHYMNYLDGQVNFKYIYSDKPLSTTQQEINDLFTEYGIQPTFRINFFNSSLDTLYNYYSNLYIRELIILAAYILLYIILEIICIKILEVVEALRIRLYYTEGLKSKLDLQFLSLLFTPSLLSIIISAYIGTFTSIKSFIFTIAVVFILDFCTYIVIFKKNGGNP